jgi:hypothetical protein
MRIGVYNYKQKCSAIEYSFSDQTFLSSCDPVLVEKILLSVALLSAAYIEWL